MEDRRVEILNIYDRVTKIVWQRLSPTFGLRTINAIAKNVIARQGQTHSFIKYIQVSEDGLDWGEAKLHVGEVSEEELDSSLEALLDEFFDALSNLIGRLIVGKLFQEAEEMAKKGDVQ